MKSNVVNISGVGVDLTSADIQNAKNEEDLKKLGIFDHLSEKKQADAYQKLGEALANYQPEEEE